MHPMKIVYRRKILDKMSFINNLIINYSYNFCLDIFTLNHVFTSDIFLLYKIRIFRYIISLFKFCKFNKNIKKTRIVSLHTHFFQKLSYDSFIHFLRNFTHLQICNIRILEKLFFELEFFYEKNNIKVFFSVLSLIYKITFFDRSIIEHFLSYFKSHKDVKCDLNGYEQMKLTRVDLDHLFSSRIYEKFHTYQKKILEKKKNARKNIEFFFLLNKNFKSKFGLVAFKVKIKQKKFKYFRLNINYNKFKIILHKKANWFLIGSVYFFLKCMVYRYSDNLIIHKLKFFYWLIGFVKQENFVSYFVFKFICNYNQNRMKKCLKYSIYINHICNLKVCVSFLKKYISILKYKIYNFSNINFFFNNVYIQRTKVFFFYTNHFMPVFFFLIIQNKFRISCIFFFFKLILFVKSFYNNSKNFTNCIKVFGENVPSKFQMHFQIVYNIVKYFLFSDILFLSNKKNSNVLIRNSFTKNLFNSRNVEIYFFNINVFFWTKLCYTENSFLILITDFTIASKFLPNSLKISNLGFDASKKIFRDRTSCLKLLKFFQKKIIFNYKIYDKKNNLIEYLNRIHNSSDKIKFSLQNYTNIFFLSETTSSLYKIKYKKLVITKKNSSFCD